MDDGSFAIIEQIDIECLTPGGIDSLIRDMIVYSGRTAYVIGVSNTRPVGQWVALTFYGRNIHFLPVARMSKESSGRIPHSLRVVGGMIRFRRRIPRIETHTHRVEIGVAHAKVIGSPRHQFIHNDSAGLLGPNSDSFWRRLPAVYLWLEKAAVRSARSTTCFSVSAADRLRVHSAKVRAQQSWVDPQVFFPSADPSDAGVLRIAWVGRLDTQKDPKLAISAIDVLKKQGVDVRMTMAGTGPLQDEVSQLVAHLGLTSEVSLVGALPRDAVGSLLRESDALLMTSHYEGSPVVVAEAGASGIPVIGTRESDPDSAIDNGTNGFVTSRDPSELARSILSARLIRRDDCTRAAAHRTAPVSVPQLAAFQV